MNTEFIEHLLYSSSEDEVIKEIKTLQSEEDLYIFITNYNWDNGFEIPDAVIANPNCTLSVALATFDLADGFSYLTSCDMREELPDWNDFLTSLYEKIVNKDFKDGEIMYSPSLTRVEKFKLSKTLKENELIFIEDIPGKEIDITL